MNKYDWVGQQVENSDNDGSVDRGTKKIIATTLTAKKQKNGQLQKRVMRIVRRKAESQMQSKKPKALTTILSGVKKDWSKETTRSQSMLVDLYNKKNSVLRKNTRRQKLLKLLLQ